MTATTTIAVSQTQVQIREANDNFETTFAQGNATGMASLYTPRRHAAPFGERAR
jgi:hypothetical protein